MGQLKPPASGVAYVDTNALIYRVERIEPYLTASAATLRAAHGLNTPDAIQAATALAAGCVLFVTNDAGFRRVPGLPVAALSEVAAS